MGEVTRYSRYVWDRIGVAQVEDSVGYVGAEVHFKNSELPKSRFLVSYIGSVQKSEMGATI